MEKTKYTPGPWDVEPDNDRYGSYWINGAAEKGEKLADMEDWANARLIAAAPDLLVACRVTANCLEAGGLGQDKPLIRQLRAAISKAEGRD